MEKEREVAARILDKIDDALEKYGVEIPNLEKLEMDNPAQLVGEDYYSFEDAIVDILNPDKDVDFDWKCKYCGCEDLNYDVIEPVTSEWEKQKVECENCEKSFFIYGRCRWIVEK